MTVRFRLLKGVHREVAVIELHYTPYELRVGAPVQLSLGRGHPLGYLYLQQRKPMHWYA